jgi:hypothetical protein
MGVYMNITYGEAGYVDGIVGGVLALDAGLA